jgi:hypothetical protein
MNKCIGGRYILQQQVLPSSGKMVFHAKDQSLNRNVLLYFQDFAKPLGRAAGYTHERFMHILDGGFAGEESYVVLKSCAGRPLLQELKRHRMTSREMLAKVLELGKVVQEAMEEGMLGFSVAAENLWLGEDGHLLVINYWDEAEHSRRGAIGLCGLLYQLATRSETVPDLAETYENRLRLAMHDLPMDQKEAVLSWTRRAFKGQLSLSAFLLGLRDALGIQEQPTVHFGQPGELPEDESDVSEKERRLLLRKIFIAGGILAGLIVIAGFLVKGFHSGDKKKPVPATPAVVKTQPDTQPKQPSAKAQQESEAANAGTADSDANQTTVAVPNLVGLAREDAEKRALAAGLHYTFYLENNDQAKGTVFKQDPQPGETVAKGGSVTFWVSKGK